MKYKKSKSLIAVIITAVIAIVCGVFAITSDTRKTDGGNFNGSYSLNAYADTGIGNITVLDKSVDVVTFAPLTSECGQYQLYITIIDTADLDGLNVHLSFGFGEELYFNGLGEEGFSNVVYSAISSGESTLTVAELIEDFNLSESFKNPRFAVVEVRVDSILDKIGSLIVAERHNLEIVEGKASTCTENGYKAYYTCADEGCTKYFADKYGVKEITDLDAWKSGDGKIDAVGHSYVDHICTTCGDLEKVADNGVYYQFTANEGDSGYHFVACGKADGFSRYTGTSAETLVLKNEIDGYPVTEIDANAFANTDGNPIKSVIVPENIANIGTNAFLDNYGMESAVFFAPTIYIAGKFSISDTSTPFFGCSTTKGGDGTNMSLYFNSSVYTGYNEKNDLTWTKFSYDAGWRKYIGCDPIENLSLNYDASGGGALYANGSWSMVNTTISGADIVTECNFADVVNANVTTGLVNEYYTKTQGDIIKTQLEEALSVYTNDSGANKYVVNVTVTNNIYSKATVAITVSLNVPIEIKVNSAVAFSYTLGTEVQSIGAGSNKMNVVKSGDNVILYDPVATDTTYNYTFLGWAKEVDGVLTFIESTTEYNDDTIYYPIWGASKVGTEFSASTHTNGSTLVNPTGSGIDGKWYDNSWNQVTEISTDNLVLYTRSQFTASVTFKGQNSTCYLNNGKLWETPDRNKDMSYVHTVNVLEGETISVIVNSSNECIITVKSNDGATNSEDTFYANKGSWKYNALKVRYDYTESTERSVLTLSGGNVADVTVQGNLSYSIAF